jgi:hypothetical protein
MKKLKEGDEVTWNYGRGKAQGEVAAVFTEKVTRKIKGKSITRKADEDEPAYTVVQEDGGKALKSGSELTKKR